MNDVLPVLLPVHKRPSKKRYICTASTGLRHILNYFLVCTTNNATTSIFDRSLERHFNFALDFEWLFHRLSISTIRLWQIFERLFPCTTFTTRYFEKFFTHEQILKCFTCTFLLHFFIKLLLTCITTTTTRSSQISDLFFFSHYYCYTLTGFKTTLDLHH